MFGRSLIQALVAVLAVGLLASGSCHVRACSGDCKKDPSDPLPPGDVSRFLTWIHGPWLLAEERAEARLRADLAGGILAANRELLGLSATAELAFDARREGDDLLLEIHARDVTGPCRISRRIEGDGRLSAVRVHRPR